MAVRIAFLILLAWCATLDAQAAPLPSCIRCHPPHHADLAACAVCHRGDDRTMRKNIAHRGLVPGDLARYRVPGDQSVRYGEQWLDHASCRRCHTVKAQGNRLAGNLDHLAQRHPATILDSIVNPVAFMPEFRFDRQVASLLANAIMAASEGKGARQKQPVTVRFVPLSGQKENVFVTQCGGCHRILSEKSGALGRGNAGPNLSGLLTAYYPATYGAEESWTVQRLEKWLANPRQSRSLARMQPVHLQEHQFRQLVTIFSIQVSSVIYR